jgi:hypothetical protein
MGITPYRRREASRPESDDPAGRQSVASIVPEAIAILREEAQSLATGGASSLATAMGAGALTGGAPVGELQQKGRALVDTFVRLLERQPGQLPDLLRQTSAADGGRGDSGNNESVLLLRSAQPVTAGEVAHVSLTLKNDAPETDQCTLCATDLIGAGGRRIPGSHVRLLPSPISIPAEGSTDVQIEIRVPSGTPAGCYTGLLQTDDGESLRALVHVTVGR